MADETYDFCVEGLDGWLATVTDWRERAAMWEELAAYALSQAKDLRDDHEDTLGAAWLNEYETGM